LTKQTDIFCPVHRWTQYNCTWVWRNRRHYCIWKHLRIPESLLAVSRICFWIYQKSRYL